MIDPEEVRPNTFPDHLVIYNDGAFSISYGTYDGGERCLAMRWNGETGDAIGFPQSHGKPVWFALPSDFSIPIVRSILATPHSNDQNILRVLQELRRGRQ